MCLNSYKLDVCRTGAKKKKKKKKKEEEKRDNPAYFGVLYPYKI